jgi:hypothetical protein
MEFGEYIGEDVRDVDAILTDRVKEAPAADVAPVVHGEWIGYTASAYIGCTEDGEPKWAERRKYLHKKCGRWSAIKEPFCPNCGAKMDGGEAGK